MGINRSSPASDALHPVAAEQTADVSLIGELVAIGERVQRLRVNGGVRELVEPSGDDTEGEHELRHILVAGKAQSGRTHVERVVLGSAQVVVCGAPLAVEVSGERDLVSLRGAVSTSHQTGQTNSVSRQGISPVEALEGSGGVIADAADGPAHDVVIHRLRVTGLLDGDAGRDNGVGHIQLNDLSGKLDVSGEHGGIQTVVRGGLNFLHGIDTERELLGRADAVLVGLELIHDVILLVIDSEDTLSASASKIIEMGYLTLFKKDGIRNEESALCAVPVGTYQCDVLDASVVEKETKPPVRYTQNTLVADMSCIAKYVEDNEVKALLKEKDKGKQGENGSIGTPATRAAIVVGLVNHGYLEDDGKRVISTPKAREFYRILPDEVKKADMTAYWWVMQEDVRTGKDDYHILTNSVLETVRTIVHTKYPLLSEELRSQLAAASGREQTLGVCPRCGSAVIEGKRGFGCSGYKQGCKFIIWKTQKTSLMKDCVITAANVKAWLSEPWVSLPDGKKKSGKSVKLKKLTSKAGNHFESELFLLDDASSEYGPGFVFPEQDEKEVLGRCPRCGGDVTEFPSGFSCSGHENGCGFVIWKKSKLKMLSKTTFTAKDVRAFLLGQSVRKTTLLKKNGTKFTASLVMQDDPNSPYGPNFTFGEGLDR